MLSFSLKVFDFSALRLWKVINPSNSVMVIKMDRQGIVPEVLVTGAGIAGMQASLDIADKGFEVHLVEKDPSIGGCMAQLDKTFPTLTCSDRSRRAGGIAGPARQNRSSPRSKKFVSSESGVRSKEHK